MLRIYFGKRYKVAGNLVSKNGRKVATSSSPRKRGPLQGTISVVIPTKTYRPQSQKGGPKISRDSKRGEGFVTETKPPWKFFGILKSGFEKEDRVRNTRAWIYFYGGPGTEPPTGRTAPLPESPVWRVRAAFGVTVRRANVTTPLLRQDQEQRAKRLMFNDNCS
jgi:hypothetical protein